MVFQRRRKKYGKICRLINNMDLNNRTNIRNIRNKIKKYEQQTKMNNR